MEDEKMTRRETDEIIPPESIYFNYGIGIDDITDLRDKGYSMQEAKRKLMLDRLSDAVCALDTGKDVRCILKEILTLIKGCP
jgi:hypothetical protein